MRKIREVLRLSAAGKSGRQIAAAIGSALSTVQTCLGRAEDAGLGWPEAEPLSEAALHARLYPPAATPSTRPAPDFAQLHAELSRPGVTRLLLWQEYKAAHPEGWQYSVFCEQYRRWLATAEPVLRQAHAPGDKAFVDYAGQTVPITDRHTGKLRPAQIFIGVLGCSNYTFAEATWSQQRSDWLGSQVRMLEYFGGVPAAIMPDNLKSAVHKALRYEPELKAAIAELLDDLNTRPFKKLEGCRRARFVELDAPMLKPLPMRRYEFGEWRRAKVHPDYHIEVKRAYYSVPYGLIGQRVDVRMTASAVEIFHQGQLVAAHPRAPVRGRRSTRDSHRPASHVAIIEHSLARVLTRAEAIGAATVEVLRRQARHRKHPEETLRSAQGILRLARDFTPEQLEQAAERALELQSYSYRAVRTLIETPAAPVSSPALDLAHNNVRGPEYFQ